MSDLTPQKHVPALLLGALVASALPAQAIRLNYTDQTILTWDDQGSGGIHDGSFHAPSFPATGANRVLGHVARGDYRKPPGIVLGRDLDGTAFAHPVRLDLIWHDQGSGATRSGSFWQPVAPAGYVALGVVGVAGYSAPPLTSVVCVRSDLVLPATFGDPIYSDAGSGANYDFSAWKIVPHPAGLDLGLYFAHRSHARPTGSVFCLRASAVQRQNPSTAGIHGLIQRFGPLLGLHPNEIYLPDDPAAILDHPSTTLVWETITNPGDYSGFRETIHGQTATSSTTILEDVQQALSHPNAGRSDFLYRLDYARNLLERGDLGRAKAYVRVQPLQGGALFELQFWIFYPWNGPGKAEAQCGSLSTTYNTAPVGSHYSDWESIRVRVTNREAHNPGQEKVVSVVLSRHSYEEEIGANDSRLGFSNGHPIVYVAKDSHAHYPGPGSHDYQRVYSRDIGACTLAVDLYDVTAAGGPQLDASSKYQLVSSAWPAVVTDAPDWFFFGGQWGGFDRNRFCANFLNLQVYCLEEVSNGKPGLQRRREFDIPWPFNANLGVLRPSAGVLSPAFDPNVTSYRLNVPADMSSLTLLALSQDEDAGKLYSWEGRWHGLPRGALFGKRTDPLHLRHGQELCEIDANLAFGNKRYSITVDRAFPRLGHACGPLGIELAGNSGLGQSITTTLGGYGSGFPFIGLGLLQPVPFCGCTVGHTWLYARSGASLTLPIPDDPNLLGLLIAMQGLSLQTAGGCSALQMSFSDTVGFVVGG